MPVYAEGRVEHQKRTQTATTLWPFGFVFGVQLGLLEKQKRGVPGSCRTDSDILRNNCLMTRRRSILLMNCVLTQGMSESLTPMSAVEKSVI